MNIKGLALAIYIVTVCSLFCWLLVWISAYRGASQEPGWGLAYLLIVPTYLIGLVALAYGIKRITKYTSNTPEPRATTIALASTAATIAFCFGVWFSENHNVVGAVITMLAAAGISGWMYSALYQGTRPTNLRDIPPLVISLQANDVIAKIGIIAMFPLIVHVFSFLFSFPLLIVVSMFPMQPPLAKLFVFCIRSASLVVALASAYQICRKAWPKTGSIGRAAAVDPQR